MPNEPRYNTLLHFEKLFAILSSSRFLNKEGLGGEIPFFIHSFPPSNQAEIDIQVPSLIKRLEKQHIQVTEINLYLLVIDILKRENILDQILTGEKNTPKIRLQRVLGGPLNIETSILPEIQSRLDAAHADIVFLTGIGAAYPIIRSHTILNNLQSIMDTIPLVMFFPGTYNNQALTLFDRLRDDNYYRAHSLNEYNI